MLMLIRDRAGENNHNPRPPKDTLHSILKILQLALLEISLYSSKYKEILNSPTPNNEE